METDASTATARRASLRHECKFAFRKAELHDVLTWIRLHPSGFVPLHSPRQVNNVYFDTLDLRNVEENLAGLSVREKLRFRWYGDAVATCVGALELKCKRGGLGWKIIQPVSSPIDLLEMEWQAVVSTLLRVSSGEVRMHLLAGGIPTLVNQYWRQYFATWNQSVRATVDYRQQYFDQNNVKRPNLTRRTPAEELIVVELKAERGHEEELSEIIQRFPGRPTKVSKYVTGILRAHGIWEI